MFFEVKWPKANFTTSNPILELQFISISPMTLIILGPNWRVNKDTLGEINVLINAMAKKPLYHQVIPYFSNYKVVKKTSLEH